MSETLLQRVLFLLDRIESPTISYAIAVGYSTEALAKLISDEILGKRFKATLIPRPSRLGSGPDLRVRETSSGLFGVAAEADDFIEPLPLEEDETWLYEVSLPHLVDGIRRDNGITATEFRNDAGLVSVGTKSIKDAGSFSVYLSLPNEDEHAVLARSARLNAPNARQNAILVPKGPAFSPEARRVLGDIQVLSLWEPAERGILALDWTTVSNSLQGTTTRGAVRVFRRDGQMWTLTFDGHTVHMHDAKGLSYIYQLLRSPGQPIQAAELMAAAAGQPVGSFAMGSAGAVLDDTAISQYKSRLAGLQSEIGDAERNNDIGRKEVLESEREQITRQIRSATGLGGRRRKSNDDAEKVRKAVSNAISRAITAIRKQHRPLADHLQRLIDRGQLLSYSSDEIPWHF